MEHPFFIPSEKHLNPIYFKYTHVTELPDFVTVEEFHAARAFIEVVAEGDAAVPVLDLAGASPKGEVEGLGGLEEFAESGNVNALHYRDELRGMLRVGHPFCVISTKVGLASREESPWHAD